MRPDTRGDYSRRILRVLVHIQEHLDEALALDDLAGLAAFSPFHFHRVFTGMVGEGVRQHVRRLRLERAAQRLKHTERPVAEIAFEAGYEAHEAFTRAFHAAFGASPSEYRVSREVPAREAGPGQLGRTASSRPQGEIPGRVPYTAGADVPFAPPTLETTPMNVEIRTIEPVRVAFLRHVGPYDQVGETWERLVDWAGTECLLGPKTRFLGASWDDPEVTPPGRIRYDACVTLDACVTVGGSVLPQGDVGLQTLGGGRYAVTLHEGPYAELGRTYGALFGVWFASSRYEPGDAPSLEMYLNDPGCTEPEDLLTEICVRIQD